MLVDGVEMRSCITPTSSVVGKSVTTLEGLPAYYAARMKVAPAPALHPLQEAMIAEQAAQCGYCYNGQIIKGAELLFKTPQPTDAADPLGDERPYLPVRHVSANHGGDSARGEGDGGQSPPTARTRGGRQCLSATTSHAC